MVPHSLHRSVRAASSSPAADGSGTIGAGTGFAARCPAPCWDFLLRFAPCSFKTLTTKMAARGLGRFPRRGALFFFLFLLMVRLSLRPTLFPYAMFFRSRRPRAGARLVGLPRPRRY